MVYGWVQDTAGSRGRSLWVISGKRLSISLGKYGTVFSPRYTPSWPVLTKFKCKLNQRSTLVFVLIVGQLKKLFRLPKQRPHWQNSARKALNDISIKYSVGLFWIPAHSWVRRNKTARWARKGGNCSPICWTGIDLGGSLGRIQGKR